jgi:hypothetical protein
VKLIQRKAITPAPENINPTVENKTDSKKFQTSLASRVNSVDMENIWEDLKNNKNNK